MASKSKEHLVDWILEVVILPVSTSTVRSRAELISRGVEASEPSSFGDRDGSGFFGFSDPDGNTWSVQELKVRGEQPLIAIEAPDDSVANQSSSRVGGGTQDGRA
jgi:hypothetical protein